MAVSCNVGRPRRIAVIDFTKDPDQELYDKFYDACHKLECRDMVPLARALQVSVRSVWRWKAGQGFPATKGTAMLVIMWVNNGKPTTELTQAQIAAGMFS